MSVSMLRNSEPFIGGREILLVVMGMGILIAIIAVASHAGYIMGLADGYKYMDSESPYPPTRRNDPMDRGMSHERNAS